MPRRILLLITDLEIGGTPTVVRELAVRLHRPPGVHVEVACLSKWGPVADQIRDAGVMVTALGATRSWQLPRVVGDLRRLVRDHAIDTVFSFLVHANAAAAMASRGLAGVRFLQSIQTTQPEPRWHWRVQRAAQGAAEKVVVPSESVARVAREWSAIPASKLVVIPNAVDPDDFPRSGVPHKDPRPYPIGFIGRLDPIKQVHFLVPAVAAVGEGLVHLHVFGDGPERGRLEAAVRKWKLTDSVTMHGTVPRPQDALARIGLLVLWSKAEGFGLVLIEAMAAGVPVIAADADGMRDVVRNNETGLIVHPAGFGHLVASIRSIVEDRDLRARLIHNGLIVVRERFSWDVVLAAYHDVLDLPED